MRFPTLSLILTVSTIFSATTCNGQDVVSPAMAPPAADADHPRIIFNKESKVPMMVSPPTGPAPQMVNNDNLNALSRRFLLPDYLMPSRAGNTQDATVMGPHFEQARSEVLPNQKYGERRRQERRSRLTRRMAPRRLAGERRDGLLDNAVGDLATSTTTESAPPPTDGPPPPPPPPPAPSSPSVPPPPATVPDPAGIALAPVPQPTVAPASPAPPLLPVDPESVTTTTTAEVGPAPAPTSAPTTDASAVPDPTPTPSADSPSSPDEEAPAETSRHPSPSKDTHSNTKLRPFVSGPTNDSSAYDSNDTQEQDRAIAMSEESSGNGTGITVGIIVVAVVIICAIGVWIFRKWKLSPSRQFKSKIAAPSSIDNTSSTAIVGPAADNATIYGAGGHDNGSDYQNSYDAIYNHQTHDSNAGLSHQQHHQHQPPMDYTMSATSNTSLIAATAMSAPVAAYQQQQQYSHPYAQQQAYGYEQEYIQHDQYSYGQQQYEHQHYAYPQHPQQYQDQAHVNMSSAASGSVTEYGQYRHSLSGSTASAATATGMTTGARGAGGGPAMVSNAPTTGHNIHGYGSEDYSQDDQFLRELRE